MNKILLFTILAVILLSVSFTSVSALSPENEKKLNDKLKSLEKKIKELVAENTKLKSENTKLKSENTKLKSENTKLKSENTKLKSEKPQTTPQVKPQTTLQPTQKESASPTSTPKLESGKQYDLNSETCKAINGIWEGTTPSTAGSTAIGTVGNCKMFVDSELKSNMLIPENVLLLITDQSIFTNSGKITIKDNGGIGIGGKLINNGKINVDTIATVAILNIGEIQNNESGKIWITNSFGIGIDNTDGLLHNSGKITIDNKRDAIGIDNYSGKIVFNGIMCGISTTPFEMGNEMKIDPC